MKPGNWINARDVVVGDRIETSNGMRAVLRINALESDKFWIVIQDSGAPSGMTSLRVNEYDPIYRLKTTPECACGREDGSHAPGYSCARDDE